MSDKQIDKHFEYKKLQFEIEYYSKELCPDFLSLKDFESQAKKFKEKLKEWEKVAKKISY
jgi:hypothetical protein